MKKKTKSFMFKLVGSIIVIALLCVIEYFGILSDYYEKNTIETGQKISQEEWDLSELKIYFFDVGQADSVLVINNNKTMLIDAGNNEDGQLLVNYIKELGITKIDYLIGTHMHEDHIGGLDDIIDNFEIETIYFPYQETVISKTYEDVIDSISSKNLKISKVNIDDNFEVGRAKCKVVYVDNNSPEDLNDSSICLEMEYGEQKYLFMGDATSSVEKNMKLDDISVLKVGHHGSKTSTSNDFLEKIKPEIAVVSVGEKNEYGHPTKETLNRLEKIGCEIYRTDVVGTIVILSDGNSNTVTTIVTNTDGE